MEESARDVEGTLFRASQPPCRAAGLRLSAKAVSLMEKKPREVKVAVDENGVITALVVGDERIPLITSVEADPATAVLCRVDGDDLTVVGNIYQKATAQDSRAAGARAAAVAAAEAAAPKKELKKVSIENMPPAPRADDDYYTGGGGMRKKRKSADMPGLLPTPAAKLGGSSGSAAEGGGKEKKWKKTNIKRLTFDHGEPWLECSVQGVGVTGAEIREFLGHRVSIPDNGVWWLPTTEAIDRKESCLCYVRVNNMAEVSRSVDKSGDVLGNTTMAIAHASPESVSILAHFGLQLRDDLSVARAMTLLTDTIPEHSTTRCLKVWTKVLPRWRTQGKTLRTEKMFRMFHNGYFREIDHVTLTLSVLGTAHNRPEVSAEDLAWAISALNTLRNGLRHIMVTIRSRTLEACASMDSVWATEEERKKAAQEGSSG